MKYIGPLQRRGQQCPRLIKYKIFLPQSLRGLNYFRPCHLPSRLRGPTFGRRMTYYFYGWGRDLSVRESCPLVSQRETPLQRSTSYSPRQSLVDQERNKGCLFRPSTLRGRYTYLKGVSSNLEVRFYTYPSVLCSTNSICRIQVQD